MGNLINRDVVAGTRVRITVPRSRFNGSEGTVLKVVNLGEGVADCYVVLEDPREPGAFKKVWATSKEFEVVKWPT